MNLKELKDLIDLINNNDITEFEIEEEGKKIKIKKKGNGVNVETNIPTIIQTPVLNGNQQVLPQKPQDTLPVKLQQDAKEKNESVLEIVSPMVGTFYRTSSPNVQPFVNEGDNINEGQTICIIEAMKLMNEVKAEFKCKIIKILVENGSAVEYSQPIFIVEKI